MGDISRHRDIYLNTRGAIPKALLDRVRVAAADLTYLELGNYLTDVSQFRDPVSYIFAKRKVWQEKVLPQADHAADAIKGILLLLGTAGAGVLAATGKDRFAPLAAAGGALGALIVSNDLLADIAGVDDWIDRMLGVPIDGVKGRRRTDAEYGLVGQFFQHFIEGITQLLFAQEAARRVPGPWAALDRIPEDSLAAVFGESFTQYFPHEHTDQPPYVWDASERPRVPRLYGTSRRQASLAGDGGVMAVVDRDYIPYLAEGLSTLEAEWRRFKPADIEARRRALVRLGKILHGVEDWFFHSNVVELIRLRSHTPGKQDTETEEVFVQRFVRDALKAEPVFMGATREERIRMQRYLHRRLRFPVYERGTRENSAGIASRKPSTLSLDLAYPAFPSQQDTAHTLLGALENLEGKLHGAGGGPREMPPWLGCVLEAFVGGSPEGLALFREKAAVRGIAVPADSQDPARIAAFARTISGDRSRAVLVDVLREWIPLVVTLLDEGERQRLVANVDPLLWSDAAAASTLPKGKPGVEEETQLKRHALALQPKLHADGITESNYARAVRLLRDCGYLAPRGRAALDRAFAIDRTSQALNARAPGAGGFLIRFVLQMQEATDKSQAETKRLNEFGAIHDPATDNGAFEEIVGSHSLMSKDTVDSSPFFDDAKVMASVASQAVLHILLDEVSAPAGDTALDWQKVLRHLIRYPKAAVGWERRALAHYRNKKAIPAFADLPELARLRVAARLPRAALERQQARDGTKAQALEEAYIRLEKQVAAYRYP
jgi:hypothetical protein